jgi:hypothetical protein
MNDEEKEDVGAGPGAPLVGTAPKGMYRFFSRAGNAAEGQTAIFPIIKQLEDETIVLIGTGFFICTNGIFATAKHVLSDVLSPGGIQTHPIGIFHFFPPNQFVLRPILRFSFNTLADVAVGVAALPRHIETNEPLVNPVMTLTLEQPSADERIVTYAYPNTTIERHGASQMINFRPDFYSGKLAEVYLEGRDRCLLPGPCYRTSMHIHGGASGGPVVDPQGRVFGINSTGFGGTDISYVSRINEILPLSIDVEETGSVRRMDMLEVASRGFISFVPGIKLEQ